VNKIKLKKLTRLGSDTESGLGKTISVFGESKSLTSRPSLYAVTALALTTLSLSVNADLVRMGPAFPAHGFPAYYQDNTGLALDLCLPNAQELADGSCLMFPADVPNPANLNFSVPANFPDEAFWFNAGTVIPLDTGIDPNAIGNATLVLGLEAAFAGGPPAVNDQVVFSRVRYKFIAPSEGEYTVITPYTRDTFNATAGELIFNTLDIGLTCPQGDFSCAMKGKTAPFLRASATPGGAPLPPVVLPGGRTFIADPNADVFVTDGPEGHSFIIRGPNGDIVNTDTFNVLGRVHTDPLPSFTTLDRVTYSRTASSSQVDVFATSISGLNQIPAPHLQLLAPDIPGAILTQDGNLPTKYHAQVKPNGVDLPANVFVTNLTDVPPTVLTGELTDLVRVTSASYDSTVGGGTLTVTATSSDEVNPPNLTVIGSNNVNYGSFAAGTTFTASGIVIPPDSVKVISSAGGSEHGMVATNAVAVDATVIANNDTPLSAELGAINVLANDNGIAPTAVVHIVRRPENGNVTVGPDNVVAYSPRGSFSGPDNFTYYVDNNVAGNVQLSNIASVDFEVTAVNRPPVATADTASVTQNSSVTIDAIANDSDPDGNTISISNPVITSATPIGSVSIVGGKVVYSVPSGAAVGSQTISYTLSDGTLTATGTITVAIQAAETVLVPKASYATRNRTWSFEGTHTPLPVGTEIVTIRFYAGPATTQTSAGVTGVANEAQFIGQATATAGRFKFGPTVSTVIPIGTTFHVKSSRGTVRNFTHTITN